MDPNAALRRWRTAITDGDFEEARDALQDLKEWLRRGGFPPTLPMTPKEKTQLGIDGPVRYGPGSSKRRNPQEKAKIKASRIRLNRGGYDPQGRYWGTGEPLYFVYLETTDGAWLASAHQRASSAKEAKALFKADLEKQIRYGGSSGQFLSQYRINPIRHFPKTKRGRPPASRKWDMTALDANGKQLARKTLTASKRDAYKSASGLVGKRYGKSAVAKVLLDGPK